MRLLLSMLSWPDGTKPEVREIDNELAIGRGRESGWILPDPASQLSRQHCLLAPYGDGWRVTDLSLNGTFINNSPTALGRQRTYELHDGDRLRIGAYIIEARYQAPANLRGPSVEHSPFGFPPAGTQSPSDMYPGTWSPDAGSHNAWPPNIGQPSTGQQAHWGATPEPFPSGGYEPHARPGPDDFIGHPSADHSPAVSDAWHMPAPGRVVIPEDWDLEDHAVPAQPALTPTATPVWPPVAQPPAGSPSVEQLGDDWDLDHPVLPKPATVNTPTPAAITPPVAPPVQPFPAELPAQPLPVAPPVQPIAIQPSPPQPLPVAPPAVANDSALLAAFLLGAQMRDTGDADPVAMMESVGKMLRVMIDRLREVQANRGSIKREFRILATLVNAEDNNPIKFSASNEAAMRSLLTGKRAPDRAVGEVLDEIRLHELAMIAAMRDAVRELLETLNPAKLKVSDGGLTSMLPVQRKARAFDQYEALHARTVQALADDFDSVFGKAFARAYERVALDEENAPMRTRPKRTEQ